MKQRQSKGVLPISVVIPLFNKRDTVVTAVRSVLEQHRLPREIIVVDDESSDGGADLVDSYFGRQVNTIRCSHSGVSAARNMGMRLARQPFVAFLDADDEWCPAFLTNIASLMHRYRYCKIFVTNYFKRDADSSLPNGCWKVVPDQLRQPTGIIDYFELAYKGYSPLHPSSLVVERSALLKIGGFPEGVKAGEDLITWAKLALDAMIAYRPTPSSIYNVALEAGLARPPDLESRRYLCREYSVLNNDARARSHTWLRPYAAKQLCGIAEDFLLLGKRREAIRCLMHALVNRYLGFRLFFRLLLALLPSTIVSSIIKRLRYVRRMRTAGRHRKTISEEISSYSVPLH